MRNLLLGATIAAVLTFAASAQAVTLQTTDTSQPWQAWANQSQAPTYAGPITLTVGANVCAEEWGCTAAFPQIDQATGQILPGPPASIGTQISSGSDERATLYHELGQAFWLAYMTPADEDRFMQIVDLNGTSADWQYAKFTRVVNGVTLTFPPFEWFAEGYRYCATYGINQPLGVNDEEGLGYPGREAWFAGQQREVCQLIDQIGSDNGIATPAQTPTHFTGHVISVRIRTIRRMRALARIAAGS